MLEAVRETKVKFVLCAEKWNGQLHIKKNDATCVWSSVVSICDGGEPRGESMQKMSAVVGVKLGTW